MLPRANLDDFSILPPPHVLMRHRANQGDRSASLSLPIVPERTRGPSSSSHHICSTPSKFLALFFRHYAAPWHAYLYFSLEKYITTTLHVKPNARNSKRRREAYLHHRFHHCTTKGLSSSFRAFYVILSCLSLDDGRAT